MNTTLVNYKDIIVEERFRVDYKDVDQLAESIRDNGLIQPPCVNIDTMELVAGGRRHRAWGMLLNGEIDLPVEGGELDFTQMPVYLREVEGKAHMMLLELEENLRREDMTWQENAVGIYEYNQIAKDQAYSKGDTWTQVQTGQLLNLSQARVATVLKVVKSMKKEGTGSRLWQCDTMMEAIKLLMADKLDEYNKEKLNRVKATQKAAIPAELKEVNMDDIMSGLSKGLDFDTVETGFAEPVTVENEVITMGDISNFYRHGNCLELLKQLTKVDHIVCDPPYGIDMKNLDTTASVDRITDTHQVEDNIQLLEEFLQVAYDVLPDHGFLCMWYDMDHHEKIQIWANSIGFKVCRWPLTWCKTSPCRNSAAQYNFTKSTEVCMIMRKSEHSILNEKQQNNYVLAGSTSSATHPFLKPIDVWNRLITAVSREGQVIVDPFAGEGSSLEAIYKLDRTPIGLEIDDSHIANGVMRLHKELNKPEPITRIF